MKFLKNKLYVHSFFVYILFAGIAFILSLMFLKLEMDSFLISNFTALKTSSENTIVVVVDDESKKQYPVWDSNMYTELLDYFDTYAKPKVIGYDFTISKLNPNNKGDMSFINKVSQMKNLVIGFTPSPLIPTDDEKLFIDKFSDKYSVKILGDDYFSKTAYNKIMDAPYDYIDSINNFGSVIIKDKDETGKVFSTISLVQIGDKYYPSLPLKMYLIENSTNEISLGNDIIVPKTGLKIPHNIIHRGHVKTNLKYYDSLRFVNQNGDNIKNEYTHDAVSAYRIINTYRNLKAGKQLEKGDIPPELFKDTSVFIGHFVTGPSADYQITPMSSRHPGVDVQATAYDNIKLNDFIYYAGFYVSLFAILFISFVTFFCVFRYSFVKSLLLLLILDVLFFITCGVSAIFGYILDFMGPISVQLITLIFGYSFKFITENRNKEKIKQAMGKYLSQDIMKNVVSNIDDLKLGGKRAVVTVLFSDIRGFTSLSEKMSAEEVSMILNEYFSEMEPIITKYNGVINKFIGDAVMAIFGEPIQDINHPKNAVKCAYEMLKKVEYLREKWLFEGKPKIEIGVGINTGEVFIGNIGTESRMEYTVIGDTVNLASRIESYNKVYRTNLLVSSSTYSYIADIADVIKINEVQIRGKSKKMNIYEVLRLDNLK